MIITIRTLFYENNNGGTMKKLLSLGLLTVLGLQADPTNTQRVLGLMAKNQENDLQARLKAVNTKNAQRRPGIQDEINANKRELERLKREQAEADDWVVVEENVDVPVGERLRQWYAEDLAEADLANRIEVGEIGFAEAARNLAKRSAAQQPWYKRW